MNILVISYEAWRETNNGGNVLSNIFSAFPNDNIAQIYCSGELPENGICKKYFQISESMLLTRQKGRQLEEKDYLPSKDRQDSALENKINSLIPKPLKHLSQLARETMWTVMNWKTKELDAFVSDFKPDIIFAPCYYYYHVSKVALYAKGIAKCPMISYISDDNYSLRQICFAPSFWINRLITRKWIRSMFAESALIYTMTQLQKTEYEKIFKRPMKLLCKSASFDRVIRHHGNPVTFIYAGSLYVNRWKIIEALADSVSGVNDKTTKAQLHIFSGSELSPRLEQKLNDGKNTFFHGLIPYQALEEWYKKSDVAVFAESFDLKNRLVTRLSFSTKIIDCLSSGCAVLAVGPADQGGMAYLKDNDAAVCVNNIKELPEKVRALVENKDLIVSYSEKANQLGKKNHMKADIERGLRKDFYGIAAEKASACRQA